MIRHDGGATRPTVRLSSFDATERLQIADVAGMLIVAGLGGAAVELSGADSAVVELVRRAEKDPTTAKVLVARFKALRGDYRDLGTIRGGQVVDALGRQVLRLDAWRDPGPDDDGVVRGED